MSQFIELRRSVEDSLKGLQGSDHSNQSSPRSSPIRPRDADDSDDDSDATPSPGRSPQPAAVQSSPASESYGGLDADANPRTARDGRAHSVMSQDHGEDGDADEDENDDEDGNGAIYNEAAVDSKDFGDVMPDDISTIVHGNFDIILDPFSRISQLHLTPHVSCATLCLVPVLTGC